MIIKIGVLRDRTEPSNIDIVRMEFDGKTVKKYEVIEMREHEDGVIYTAPPMEYEIFDVVIEP